MGRPSHREAPRVTSDEELRARVRALYGDGIPVRASYRADATGTPERPAESLAEIAWPVRLLLPWSYLVSDNLRHGVIDGRLILTSAYRRAKGLIRDAARSKLAGCEPAACPLALVARVWVPDEIRAHDVPNFAKCCHDALESVVYTKDRWLWDTRWIRAGVDVDAPRAEVTITPIPQ
jgi:hypothetical protein